MSNLKNAKEILDSLKLDFTVDSSYRELILNSQKLNIERMLHLYMPNANWEYINGAFVLRTNDIESGFLNSFPFFKWEVNRIIEIDVFSQLPKEKYQPIAAGRALHMGDMLARIQNYILNNISLL